MDTDDDFTGPVNLGNSTECTILQLAQTVIAMTGSKSQSSTALYQATTRHSANRT